MLKFVLLLDSKAKTVDQTLPIDIEVKNVEYILVSLIPAIKLKTIDHKVPRGMNFIFKVSLHDNLGTEFSETIGDGNELYYELATTDMVDVQINNNFSIAVSVPYLFLIYPVPFTLAHSLLSILSLIPKSFKSKQTKLLRALCIK